MPDFKPEYTPDAAPVAHPTSNPAAQGASQPDPVHVNLPAATAKTGLQPGQGQPDLRLPHERDQSAVDVTAPEPDPVVAQAARDLASGQVDTDLRNQPGLDAERRRDLLKQQR